MGARLILFDRHLSTALSMPPKHWTSETASGREALACPSCGGVYELPDGHRVLESGRVVPIVSCPYVCEFVDYVTLADWDEVVLR